MPDGRDQRLKVIIVILSRACHGRVTGMSQWGYIKISVSFQFKCLHILNGANMVVTFGV